LGFVIKVEFLFCKCHSYSFRKFHGFMPDRFRQKSNELLAAVTEGGVGFT